MTETGKSLVDRQLSIASFSMWIAKTNIGIKKVIVLMGSTILIALALSQTFPVTIPLGIGALLGLSICLLIVGYYQGVVIRRCTFVVPPNHIHEVRDYYSFRNPKDNYRLIIHTATGAIISRLYHRVRSSWAYFDIIRKVIKLPISHALMLGGGGGAMAITLLRQFSRARVDIVELSSLMIRIANRYFLLEHTIKNRLHFIHDDAFKYVRNSKTPYDLIFVDVFQGASLPTQALNPQFIQKLRRLLTTRGIVIINFGPTHGKPIRHVYQLYRHWFPKFSLYLLHGMIVGINRSARLDNAAQLYP